MCNGTSQTTRKKTSKNTDDEGVIFFMYIHVYIFFLCVLNVYNSIIYMYNALCLSHILPCILHAYSHIFAYTKICIFFALHIAKAIGFFNFN
jgi:membrane-associated HD superfamily phosphohydrolase